MASTTENSYTRNVAAFHGVRRHRPHRRRTLAGGARLSHSSVVRGTTLGDTIATVQHIYPHLTTTSTGNPGTWRTTNARRTLHGDASPSYPPGRVTTRSPITTISTGQTGCATGR